MTGDDNQNLVISLSARQLNPQIRVVARCEDARNSDKMHRAGADSAISPTHIGGLRMASEMLRPAVVNFLDVMLRREDLALRIEELAVPATMVGWQLAALGLHHFRKLLLLAVRTGDGWTYNPPRDYVMRAGETLVFMGSPEERLQLERTLLGSGEARRARGDRLPARLARLRLRRGLRLEDEGQQVPAHLQAPEIDLADGLLLRTDLLRKLVAPCDELRQLLPGEGHVRYPSFAQTASNSTRQSAARARLSILRRPALRTGLRRRVPALATAGRRRRPIKSPPHRSSTPLVFPFIAPPSPGNRFLVRGTRFSSRCGSARNPSAGRRPSRGRRRRTAPPMIFDIRKPSVNFFLMLKM